MSKRLPKFVGVAVECVVCGRMKQPHGRSAPMASDYCYMDDCQGYKMDPQAGCLWPRETDADFGYDCCDAATRQMTEGDIEKWKADHDG